MAITAKDVITLFTAIDTEALMQELHRLEIEDPGTDYDPIEEMCYTVAKQAVELYATRAGAFVTPPLPDWADLTDDDYPEGDDHAD
jgi:hypothetical protein